MGRVEGEEGRGEERVGKGLESGGGDEKGLEENEGVLTKHRITDAQRGGGVPYDVGMGVCVCERESPPVRETEKDREGRVCPPSPSSVPSLQSPV